MAKKAKKETSDIKVYVNSKTKAILETPCNISGGNWKLESDAEEKAEAEPVEDDE